MRDDHNPQIEPAEDPELDALLASSGEFAAPPDFEHRVMRTVHLPLPEWAIKVRNFRVSMFGTRSGRLILAGIAVACVTSVTMMVNFLRVNGQPVREGLDWLGRRVGSPRAVWSSFMDFVTGLLPAGMATRSFALLAAGVVAASAVGLYITAGPPALRSRHAR